MTFYFKMSKRPRSNSLESNSKRSRLKPPPARPSTPDILINPNAGASKIQSAFRPLSPRNSTKKRNREPEFKQHVKKRSKIDDLEEMMDSFDMDEIKSIEKTIHIIQNFLNIYNFATVDYTRILKQKCRIDKLQERLDHADLSEERKSILQIEITHLKALFRLKQLASRPLSF